ncbi:hypothetical protein [Aquipseudomonas alcaligenes]|uniref:hypothetical protein n=1 Tax=Aquipseudomonas alcaligenes TaxID=43263 RepID=UPI0037485578
MNRIRQLGQSMTEYMVVLGVTGAALLASTTDVTKLFDNVQRGYRTQSSEMNKVQLYNNTKVRFNENDSEEDDYDDGDTPPTDNTPLPDAASQLPSIEWVYDADGNQLGRMDGDMLMDGAGNILAWCQRTQSGDCVFVDENGNIIYGGASSTRQWVDENGNELPLMALTSGGQVRGFAYLYKNKYYSADQRKLLDPQPTGYTALPMRRVVELDGKGAPQTAGYELGGSLYSLKSTLSSPIGTAVGSEGTELVTVKFVNAPNSNWTGYSPCLVMPGGWNSNIASGAVLDPVVNKSLVDKFNDPSIRLTSDGVGGFINGATSGNCGGGSTVTYTYDPVLSYWTLTK